MSLAVDVRARVGEFHLDARFALPPGLTVLFGPSGSGKTRLLRLIAGLDAPDDGRIALDGDLFCDVASKVRLPVHERRIGMVFQRPYLVPHRTVHANVAMAVAGSRQERLHMADLWLERTGATPFASRRPYQLSGGQQQRVALARALAGAPRLLLLDEPFNALDLKRRHRLRQLVRSLVHETGVPTLFVTHDLEELDELADQVLLADDGRIVDIVTRGQARSVSR